MIHTNLPRHISPGLTREDDWRPQGLCRYDPDLFFTVETRDPESRALIRQAKAICRECPVLELCRNWYDEHPDGYAIAGGTTPGERKNAKRRETRPPQASGHGTTAGYWRHRTNKEPACDPCAQARAEHEAESERRRDRSGRIRKTA